MSGSAAADGVLIDQRLNCPEIAPEIIGIRTADGALLCGE